MDSEVRLFAAGKAHSYLGSWGVQAGYQQDYE